MNEREPDFSRVGRKKERNKSNNVLNLLIGVVVVAIVVVAITLFTGGKPDEKAIEEDATNSIEEDESSVEVDGNSDSSGSTSADLSETESETVETTPSDSSDSNASTSELQKEDEEIDLDENTEEEVTVVPSSDSNVSQSIIDESWKPVGTSQTGDHVSLYDGNSVDWNEKKRALAYATGLPEESMIFWKIKNGGGPQKSVGIVSSRDSKEKYRVYLEWVNGEGWKPVKKDILTSLEDND